MMSKITKFAALSLSILVASLISDYAIQQFSTWNGMGYKAVWMLYKN